MPSDKHNLRITGARDLISPLINVASSRDVPFHQSQKLQCMHHCATFVPLWSPILFSQPRKVTICVRHGMASARDIKINEAILYVYYVMKWVWHYRNWDIMTFMYRDMGRTFHEYILRIFCNGWMDCRDAFQAALCLYRCVTNATKPSTKQTGLSVFQ